MTDEVFAQEYEISYTKSNIGRVFPNFKTSETENKNEWCHVKEEEYFDYDPMLDVYTAMDFGRDMTYIGFFQIKRNPLNIDGRSRDCIVFFDEYSGSNKTAYQIRQEINSRNYKYDVHIGDMRTAIAKDSLGKGWGFYLQEDPFAVKVNYGIDVGPPIHVTGSFFSPNVYIDSLNTILNTKGGISFHKRCVVAISALSNWSYEIRPNERDMEGRPMLKANAKPRHDRFSHPCTGIYYGVHYATYNLGLSFKKKDSINWNGFSQKLPDAI
jgi:hypothetical protein